MRTADLLNAVIDAHGGHARWQNLDTIQFSLASGGLAFALHMQPFALRGLQVSLRPHARHLVLHGYVSKGWRGIWTPTHVKVLDENDRLVMERHNPRESFSRFDRQFHWDKLDLLYFAGYALWNYFSFPFLLTAPGVRLVAEKEAGGDALAQLVAHFDDAVPTHSKLQRFHINESGILTRHDYTADVIGRWAAAANFCLASEQVGGLRFYTRRKVYPRAGAQTVLPLPVLVWIEIDDIKLVMAGT